MTNATRMRSKKLTAAAALIGAVSLFLWVGSMSGGESAETRQVVSNELRVAFTVTDLSTAPTTSPNRNEGEKRETAEDITVNVDGGNAAGGTISTLVIKRTTLTDGMKRDEVAFTADKAAETVEQATKNGNKTARIFIPDVRDEVSELHVNISADSLRQLSEAGLNFEIYTENVRLILPASSLQKLGHDVYFRFVPIKQEKLRSEVEERARMERTVQAALGGDGIEVVGRPMIIETNLSSREAELVLPLFGIELPADPAKREVFLDELVVFIEHSDGERKLVRPEIVAYEEGMPGLQFSISKFSTFTILKMEINRHSAYVRGYPNGTFRPERGISRAEMAAILSRIYDRTTTRERIEVTAYTDLLSSHWAADDIRLVAEAGLMSGYPDGTFAPERFVTRAEMAAIVSRWLSTEEAGSSTTKFSDVAGHWALPLIVIAEASGIVDGMPDGTFRPNQTLTRAEAVVMLNRLLGRGPLQGMDEPRWQDVPQGHWAFENIHEASVEHEFFHGDNGTEQWFGQ